MKPSRNSRETVENVRRIKEIYRRHTVPQDTVMAAYAEVHRVDRAGRIFAKMRRGFELRDLR